MRIEEKAKALAECILQYEQTVYGLEAFEHGQERGLRKIKDHLVGIAHDAKEFLASIPPMQSGPEVNQPAKFVQVSGFGCENSPLTQCSYMLVALDENGVVWLKPGNQNAKWEEQ